MSPQTRERARRLSLEIAELSESIGRPVRIMEVCGTHTVSLRRHGIHSLLPEAVTLVSGPGCPVCVTPTGYIDNALSLIESGRCAVATFGDMLKVPGSDGRTPAEAGRDGRVRMIYSPLQLEALSADLEPSVEFLVFLAIGFETTIPVILRSAADAFARGDRRLLYYTAFKLVPPALTALLDDPDHGLDGFLLPGHVSMVIGADAYDFLESYGVPGAIAGFEPIQMLRGIRSLLRSIASGESNVTNEYSSVVRAGGNKKALGLMDRMLEPADALWRGIGRIPASSLAFKEEFGSLDASRVLSLVESEVPDPPGCICGSVIRGRAQPSECRHFAGSCTPDRPIGPCMVSSEGTCAASFRFGPAEA